VLINQSTDKAIINWQSFNIQNGQTTQFIQPGSSSITLNRINALNGPSTIFGALNANGQVWLINPAGMVFGKTGQVNVAGLLATTSEISDSNFLSGHYTFSPNTHYPNASIVNEGSIHIQPGGLAALIGNNVTNTGTIHAKMGTVILAGAQAYTMDFDGDQLINFVVTKAPTNTKQNTVHNTGIIRA
jgi:filamentous hemagglutinin family protein